MGYLFTIGSLDIPLFGLFAGLIVVMLLWGKTYKPEIPIHKARDIARKELMSLQTTEVIPKGDLRMTPESELQSLTTPSNPTPEILPVKYGIIFTVFAGVRNYHYLVKVSIYGDVMGTTELKRKVPIGKIMPEYKEVKGRPTFIERLRESREGKPEVD